MDTADDRRPRTGSSATVAQGHKQMATDEAHRKRVAKENLVNKEDRQYLAVPYAEREAAKAAGAKWIGARNCGTSALKERGKGSPKWLPENSRLQHHPTLAKNLRPSCASSVAIYPAIIRSWTAVLTGCNPGR